jgi:hypothetical protein
VSRYGTDTYCTYLFNWFCSDTYLFIQQANGYSVCLICSLPFQTSFFCFVFGLGKKNNMNMFLELTAGLSVGAGLLTYHLIPRFRDMFIKANLYGIDLNKASGDKVPEATGVITGKQEFRYFQTWTK